MVFEKTKKQCRDYQTWIDSLMLEGHVQNAGRSHDRSTFKEKIITHSLFLTNETILYFDQYSFLDSKT